MKSTAPSTTTTCGLSREEVERYHVIGIMKIKDGRCVRTFILMGPLCATVSYQPTHRKLLQVFIVHCYNVITKMQISQLVQLQYIQT